MVGVASAATAVVISHVAGGTKRIRVGAGGIMLPNHSPLVIAEQFGTLEALYPGRIDLGLGRAPGSDSPTMRALRRDSHAADRFPQDVMELISYFETPAPTDDEIAKAQLVRMTQHGYSNHASAIDRVVAVPGAGQSIPIWILGSSLYGAQLAAAYGLPYAFASHFAPAQMMEAVAVYKNTFKPSRWLEKPYVMLGVNIVVAPTVEEANYLSSTLKKMFLSLRHGVPGRIPPPVEGFDEQLTPFDRSILQQTLSCSIVGTQETVKSELEKFVETTGADELMVASQIFDHKLRIRSYELLAGLI